jgi:hypothetical protein
VLSGDLRGADILVGDDGLLERFRKTFGVDAPPAELPEAAQDSSVA